MKKVKKTSRKIKLALNLNYYNSYAFTKLESRCQPFQDRELGYKYVLRDGPRSSFEKAHIAGHEENLESAGHTFMKID